MLGNLTRKPTKGRAKDPFHEAVTAQTVGITSRLVFYSYPSNAQSIESMQFLGQDGVLLTPNRIVSTEKDVTTQGWVVLCLPQSTTSLRFLEPGKVTSATATGTEVDGVSHLLYESSECCPLLLGRGARKTNVLNYHTVSPDCIS